MQFLCAVLRCWTNHTHQGFVSILLFCSITGMCDSGYMYGADSTKKSTIKVLMVIPADMQLFQTRHEVQKVGKGYCAGTRVVLNSGATYAVGLRMGAEQFTSKLTVVNYLPSPVAQAEYDLIVNPILESDSATSFVNFYSQLANSNNTQIRGNNMMTIQTEDAKYYEIKAELFPAFRIRFRPKDRNEVIRESWIVPATQSIVGSCSNITTVLQSTLNTARNNIAVEFSALLEEYERQLRQK
jgi:hypothetical protein